MFPSPTSPLDSRPTDPIADLISPLAYLIDISKLSCPKLSSWLPPHPKCTHFIFSSVQFHFFKFSVPQSFLLLLLSISGLLSNNFKIYVSIFQTVSRIQPLPHSQRPDLKHHHPLPVLLQSLPIVSLLPPITLLQTMKTCFRLRHSSLKKLLWLPDPPRVKTKVHFWPARPCMFWLLITSVTSWPILSCSKQIHFLPLSLWTCYFLLPEMVFPRYWMMKSFSSFWFFSTITFSVRPSPNPISLDPMPTPTLENSTTSSLKTSVAPLCFVILLSIYCFLVPSLSLWFIVCFCH